MCNKCIFFPNQNSQVACAEDEDGEFHHDVSEGISISTEGNLPAGLITLGGPFSALIPSMIPQEIILKLAEEESNRDPNEQPEYR